MKKILLIITSICLVATIIANVVVATDNVDKLPEIFNDDIPSTEEAMKSNETATKDLEREQEELEQAKSDNEKAANAVIELESKSKELEQTIEDIKDERKRYAALDERLEICRRDFEENYVLIGLDLDRLYTIPLINRNYDTGNLREKQLIRNVYSAIGDFAGFWAKIITDGTERIEMDNYDRLVAAIPKITDPINEHLINAQKYYNFLSKVYQESFLIESDEAYNDGAFTVPPTFSFQALKGDGLLKELEYYENTFLGKYKTEYEPYMEAMHEEIALAEYCTDAAISVYELFLTDTETNREYFSELKDEKETFYNCGGQYASLSEDEIKECYINIYRQMSEVCYAVCDSSSKYTDIDRRTMENDYYDVNVQYDYCLEGSRGNTKHIFRIKEWTKRRETNRSVESFYNKDGNLLYVKASDGLEVFVTPCGTYMSGTTKNDTNKIIENYKWIYEHAQEIANTGRNSWQYNNHAESYKKMSALYNYFGMPEEEAAKLRMVEDMYAGILTEEEVFPNDNAVVFDIPETDASEFEYEINDDGETIRIKKYNGDDEQVRIPNNINGYKVAGIESNAFKNSKIITVVIPDTVTQIDNSSFSKCSSLENIVLSRSVEELSNSIAYQCPKINSVYYRGNKYINLRSIVYILNMESYPQ